MATYTPQREVPVPLSQDEIDYLKAILIHLTWEDQTRKLLNKSIVGKLEKVLPRGEMIHTVPWAEKYF